LLLRPRSVSQVREIARTLNHLFRRPIRISLFVRYRLIRRIQVLRTCGLSPISKATPYIPFKINAKAEHRSNNPLWTRMYHFYAYNEEWFKRHYHKRSNVETTFSMIKEKFGTRLDEQERGSASERSTV